VLHASALKVFSKEFSHATHVTSSKVKVYLLFSEEEKTRKSSSSILWDNSIQVVLDTLTHSARLRARSISVAYLSRGIHVSPFLYTDVHTYIFIGRKVRILENNLLSHTLICSRRNNNNNNNNNNEIERVVVYLYKEEGEEERKEEEEDIK
jgi:hypothetical protein